MANNTPFDDNDKDSSTTEIDPEKNYHEELVGTDKKYKDDQALAKSKVQGDLHINQLERELRGIRDELNSRVDMETLVTELKDLSKQDVIKVEDQSNLENQNQDETNKTEQTPEQIEQLVNSLVEKKENTNRLTRNLSEVTDTLAKNWGNKAEENWVSLRDELNMSEQELRDFASSKPQAVIKLAGIQEQKPEVPNDDSLFSQGNVQLNPFDNLSSGARDYAYFQKMRKSDPKKYHSKEVQIEMHKEAQTQQESFYETS